MELFVRSTSVGKHFWTKWLPLLETEPSLWTDTLHNPDCRMSFEDVRAEQIGRVCSWHSDSLWQVGKLKRILKPELLKGLPSIKLL